MARDLTTGRLTALVKASVGIGQRVRVEGDTGAGTARKPVPRAEYLGPPNRGCGRWVYAGQNKRTWVGE